MTLYFAVCDDNIADRKQTERLLEREKDKRLADSGDVMYIESFGSSDALLITPVRYDMFIIDMTASSQNGIDIAKSLRNSGIIAPICLLSSDINYSSFANQPDNIIHINKPITQGHISHLFDVAKDWAKKKPPLLEIRGKKTTHFVKHEDLIRAIERKSYVEVALADGTFIDVPGTLKSFVKITDAYKCFIPCSEVLLSIHHIIKLENHTFTLSNGEAFKLPRLKTEQILEQYVAFTAGHIQGNKQC